MPSTSFPREKIKIVLFEGVHPKSQTEFESGGYQVEMIDRAIDLSQDESRLAGAHVIGIRSKSSLDKEALQHCKRLLAAGCFCIGTDQVDLSMAASKGVPVFNAPFSNTRSVAELALAEVIMLARKAAHRSRLMHLGKWSKSASGSHEVRGKKLGIVGYGHIGQQLGLLAEALGLSVSYYDIEKKLPLGNAKPLESLGELLEGADFVSLHVPDTEQTRGMISAAELAKMRPGSCLLNLSRGKVVDIEALVASLKSAQLCGAALDVFPEEPATKDAEFQSELCGLDNVILTPHVGGSTEEAQENIGLEVARALLSFVEVGETQGAVNFPVVTLPSRFEAHRVLYIHRNEPGALRDVNDLVASLSLNIQAQYLQTLGDVGYLIMDVEKGLSHEVKQQLEGLSAHIRARLLF